MDLRFASMQATDFSIKIRFVGIYIATVFNFTFFHFIFCNEGCKNSSKKGTVIFVAKKET